MSELNTTGERSQVLHGSEKEEVKQKLSFYELLCGWAWNWKLKKAYIQANGGKYKYTEVTTTRPSAALSHMATTTLPVASPPLSGTAEMDSNASKSLKRRRQEMKSELADDFDFL